LTLLAKYAAHFQELEVLFLLMDLFPETQQPGPFRSAERLGVGPLRGFDPTTFVSDPAVEGSLVNASAHEPLRRRCDPSQ
jgi:hypothetical protein